MWSLRTILYIWEANMSLVWGILKMLYINFAQIIGRCFYTRNFLCLISWIYSSSLSYKILAGCATSSIITRLLLFIIATTLIRIVFSEIIIMFTKFGFLVWKRISVWEKILIKLVEGPFAFNLWCRVISMFYLFLYILASRHWVFNCDDLSVYLFHAWFAAVASPDTWLLS